MAALAEKCGWVCERSRITGNGQSIDITLREPAGGETSEIDHDVPERAVAIDEIDALASDAELPVAIAKVM